MDASGIPDLLTRVAPATVPLRVPIRLTADAYVPVACRRRPPRTQAKQVGPWRRQRRAGAYDSSCTRRPRAPPPRPQCDWPWRHTMSKSWRPPVVIMPSDVGDHHLGDRLAGWVPEGVDVGSLGSCRVEEATAIRVALGGLASTSISSHGERPPVTARHALQVRISSRHAELIGELEALVGRHPLRERLWELLMVALYRAGRQVEALRPLRRFATGCGRTSAWIPVRSSSSSRPPSFGRIPASLRLPSPRIHQPRRATHAAPGDPVRDGP